MSLEITKDTKRILADWLIERWGRCPTPRQGWQGHAPSFSLYPRHVCDVPKDEPDVAQEIQEIQAIQERAASARRIRPSRKATETQGMDTVVRPEGPNGEVSRPLRPFVSLWETSPFSGRQGRPQ